jgi:hypothetical protein
VSMDKNILLLPTKTQSIDPTYSDVYYCRNPWKEENNKFICP